MENNTEFNRAIGIAIKEGLTRKEMTQRELAEIVGSTQRSISSYVTGHTQPPIDILYQICMTLELSLNQVLQLPEFHNPHRIVKDKEELDYLQLLEGLSRNGRKDFLHAVKLIRKLMK